jgi:hypothetical protein
MVVTSVFTPQPKYRSPVGRCAGSPAHTTLTRRLVRGLVAGRRVFFPFVRDVAD